MKIHNEEFNIETKNINKDTVFCIIGDIHNTSFSSLKVWNKIIEEVRKTNPNFIIIPGDLIYDADDLNCIDKLTHLLTELSKIAPLYITYGNHDFKKGKKLKFADTNNYFNSLEQENNGIHLINNKVSKVDKENIYLIGISPSYDSYYSEYKSKWAMNFITELLKIDVTNIENNSTLILVIHSPEILKEVRRYLDEKLSSNELSTKTKEELKRVNDILDLVDVFVCAHMHNGLIPRAFEFGRKKNKSNGIVACESQKQTEEEIGHKVKFRVVDFCRGMHDFYNGKIIISRGVTKWPKSILNPTGSKDINTIKLLKK
jgi:predicted MPP superfamily phosphohydrolase